jgi:hypothetical protein
MIEGSHSFKLWLFPNLPSETNINRYTITSFSPRSLSYELEELYRNEYGTYAKQPISLVHHQGIRWQKEAIDFLKSEGIKLDIEKLFTPQDYSKYKYLYGLKYYGH